MTPIEYIAPATPFYKCIAPQVNEIIENGSRGQPFLSLLKALGCRYLQTVDHTFAYGYSIETPQQPPAEDKAFVVQSLQRILDAYVRNGFLENGDGFALINGLYAHGRWRSCLSNADYAYGLAALCASLTAAELPLDRQSGGGVETPCVCLLLNEWLQPTTPFTAPPLIPDLSRLLFGDAWYTFNVELAEVPNWQAPSIIYETRPAFLPGVVCPGLDPAPSELPLMEGA